MKILKMLIIRHNKKDTATAMSIIMLFISFLAEQEEGAKRFASFEVFFVVSHAKNFNWSASLKKNISMIPQKHKFVNSKIFFFLYYYIKGDSSV